MALDPNTQRRIAEHARRLDAHEEQLTPEKQAEAARLAEAMRRVARALSAREWRRRGLRGLVGF